MDKFVKENVLYFFYLVTSNKGREIQAFDKWKLST